MRNFLILLICFFSGIIMISCVTTTENSSDVVTSSEKIQSQTSETLNNPGDSENKTGVIYNSRSLSDGPLLLGSKEYLSGPVAEFSVLYTIYFPLTGILIPDSEYRVSFGTRWQAESEKLVEDVFIERALLSEDDEGKSWWFFKVAGDGFEREYEFLVDRDWELMEMRYSVGSEVFSYIPPVDEIKNLSNGSLVYRDFKTGKEKITTPADSFYADHIILDSSEYWMTSKVTGNFVRAQLKEDQHVVLTASLLEEIKGYKTKFNSY